MIVRRIPRYRKPVRCVNAGHAQMNIPDLIDGFVTWQSTPPCRANQETPFVDERVFQNRGVCEQAFPSLPSRPPSRTFLCSPQFSRGQKSEKCLERAESLTETLATQATRMGSGLNNAGLQDRKFGALELQSTAYYLYCVLPTASGQ